MKKFIIMYERMHASECTALHSTIQSTLEKLSIARNRPVASGESSMCHEQCTSIYNTNTLYALHVTHTTVQIKSNKFNTHEEKYQSCCASFFIHSCSFFSLGLVQVVFLFRFFYPLALFLPLTWPFGSSCSVCQSYS